MFEKRYLLDIKNGNEKIVLEYLGQFTKIKKINRNKYFKNIISFTADLSAETFEILKIELVYRFNTFLNLDRNFNC